ncbi:GNAT family N-acetyltransferase [Streptomyces sp. NPDC096538]|uniref:GNAT family N-acetyltransferase n=1 Tax=Streptomyces sp. NPDC096538 TaxID=3155427 RepID=UPI003325DC6F
MTGPRIRPMTADDCAGVAGIRVAGWRYAYRGLVPQAYLDRMDVAEEAGRQRARLAAGDGSVVDLVAEAEDGTLAGWAAYGPYRDGDVRTEDGELYALYVPPERIGQGLGRTLLTEVTGRCAAAGHRRVFLWVLRDNARARRFYTAAGYTADGTEEHFELAGIQVPEVRYVRELV